MSADLWSNVAPSRTIPATVRAWLLGPNVLTAAFQAQSAYPIRLEVLAEGRRMPLADEQLSLDAGTDDMPWIREIYLRSSDVVWSYGRVMVPATTYLRYQAAFDSLGTQFLGQTLLHGRTDVVRSPFVYYGAPAGSPWYHLASAYLSTPPAATSLWGRRSVFWMGADPLLLSEFFFPDLPEYTGG